MSTPIPTDSAKRITLRVGRWQSKLLVWKPFFAVIARLVWTVAMLMAVAPAAANRLVASRLVARTGAAFPTDMLGASFNAFNAPTLDPTGRAAFLATMESQGGQGGMELGVWSEASGFLTQVARAGGRVPNDPLASFVTFADPLLSPSGVTSFVAQLANDGAPGSTGLSVWRVDEGVLGPTIRRGEAAPDAPAGTVFAGSGLLLSTSSAGALAFEGFLAGPGVGAANDEAIYADDGAGGWRIVAREGDQAPNTPTGVRFSNLFEPVQGASGQVALLSPLAGPGVTAENDRGIWTDSSGSLSLLARTGDAAPGAPRGGVFQSFSPTNVRVNSSGHTTFIAATNPTTDSDDDQGVWSDRSGLLAPIAVNGDPTPGIANGAFDVFSEVRMNRHDRATLVAFASGPGVTVDNRMGVWTESAGGMRLVAREGDAAPDVEDGAVFSAFQGVSINRWGQTAFFGTLRGEGVEAGNDSGIWIEELDGSLRLVIREGDQLPIGPEETGTVAGISFAPGDAGESGGRSGLNDRGQVGFAVQFVDGSAGLFVSDVGVPLPGDFNGDGIVDAADYSVWRDALGGVFVASEFDLWLGNFGGQIGSWSVAVPEPSAAALVAIGVALARGGRSVRRC